MLVVLQRRNRWSLENQAKPNQAKQQQGESKMGNQKTLAGISYELYDMEELSKITGNIPPDVCQLHNDFGILKYNPKADAILNKRQAASVYVMIADIMDYPTVPTRQSRTFSMACMGHLIKNNPSGFTKDFLKNCDDIYIKHATLGYNKDHAKHQAWVDKALKNLNDEQLDFACALFANIQRISKGSVSDKVKQNRR